MYDHRCKGPFSAAVSIRRLHAKMRAIYRMRILATRRHNRPSKDPKNPVELLDAKLITFMVLKD